MKGYKGFEKGLVCRGKQYAENAVFEEDKAEICNSGMHFCELPHQVFEHYSPGENHEFAEVEALDEVFTDDNSKYCTKKLKIGTKVSVLDICKISVNVFFEKFDFNNKINKARESKENNAGDRGAANAGNRGAAIVREDGSASVGKKGVAVAFDGQAKGSLGAVIVLIESDDDGNITNAKSYIVDGEKVKADTYYRLKGGRRVEVK